MPLNVYNTLSRRKELFEPLHAPRVGMYVCGPTVYGHAHLGHAKSYVHFDVINRWLRHGPHVAGAGGARRGYDVQYVQNITDVGHLTDDADEGEDKIIAEARRRGLHPMAVADFFTRSYEEDMRALNVLPPDIAPRASGHIPEQIAMIAQVLAAGQAYVVNGSVYFDVAAWKDYGKLSGRKLEEQEAGARVAVNSEKRHPADFALWKRAEPGHIMQWDSPWGRGFPGWHIECSAMSVKYLGQPFDIHGGGLENQFPHHECEICQAEAAAHGQAFARYWLHNNMVTINGQKMGKSLNNYVRLKELFSGRIDDADRAANVQLSQAYDPMVVRFLILQSHYRSPIDFSDESLKAAKGGWEKLRDLVRRLETEGDPSDRPAPAEVQARLDALRQRFAEALDDDFNSAAGLAVLFEAASLAGNLLATPATCPSAALRRFFADLADTVLGLNARGPAVAAAGAAGPSPADAAMGVLIGLRNEARRTKDFKTSDTIRDQLKAAGIELLDGKDGTRWKAVS